MADTRQGPRTIEHAPVCSDVEAVQFDGKGEEGRIVEGEAEIPAQPRGAPQEWRGRRSNDEWKGFQIVDGLVKPPCPELGLQEQDIADFVEQQSGDMHFERSSLDFSQEDPGFRQQIFVTCLEPLDEDRGVNDELRGRTGSRGSSG